MEKMRLENCKVDMIKFENVISMAVFGSYHEECFDKNRSDIDVMVLCSRELDFNEEFEIEDYLESVLPKYFNHNNMHYTFISGFNYPFSELFVISEDKIILKEEEYLDYILGYSSFKRDRENLEIIREENLRLLEVYRSGVL
ncbi:MAG: nucleotidyltransferase domain-containing protein [Clostridium sp.]